MANAQNAAPRTDLTPLLNEKEACAYLGVSVHTVRDWRLKGRGPLFVKVGASVRYRVTDIARFVEENVRGVEHAA